MDDDMKAYPISERTEQQLEQAFKFHPATDEQAARYTHVRESFKLLAYEVARRTPPSREQSLAFTKLEEACRWAISAIAHEGK